MKGRPFLIFFGYTHCPDICPTTLSELSVVVQQMRRPIPVLFVTVDPERDTSASLKDYVESFDPHFIGLTGSLEDISKLEKSYRVYVKKMPPEKNGEYSIDHSAIVYLMDAKGAFIELVNLDQASEEVAKELSGYMSATTAD